MNNYYDVIVVGAGHAGCEAALAAARLGAKTLLLTVNMDHIAQMSCNPAVGGIAKGQVVREIDALGGAQGIVTDASSIQFRLLNRTKGPAVWSPRSQCDKVCYQRGMKLLLERMPGVDIKQGMATQFLTEGNERISGIITNLHEEFHCGSLVLANGTSLNGLLHYGMTSMPGGRAGDPPSEDLAQALREQLHLRVGRLKTGTPPRILAKTIDFAKMGIQPAEAPGEMFSHFPAEFHAGHPLPQAQNKEMPCRLVYTTKATAEIVQANLQLAPLYQGKIKGIGTRYCPSFEDKVVRFAHHEQHLLYLEPEGEFTEEYYINGISTSLPPEIQIKMINSVPGMENAVISRYAYAIEYDFIFPDQMERSMANKQWHNLFTAGQINGTSGYEEAAGQGLVAGFNAARVAAGKTTVELARDTSYIAVMIDDLVTKEINEPYRLFTSRAEYRLHLRQDNADLRLSRWAHQHGLLSTEKFAWFERYENRLHELEKYFRENKHQGKTLWEQLKQQKGEPDEPLPFEIGESGFNVEDQIDRRALKQMVIAAHYEGYLKREEASIAKLSGLENWKIPADFDYDSAKGLKNETRLKLKRVQPTTLAQASRIDGMTPAETALLQVLLTRYREKNQSEA